MDKKTISKVMRELGKRTSAAKATAARRNGLLGGRPRKGPLVQPAKYSRAVVKLADKLGISCRRAVRIYQERLRAKEPI